VRPSVHTEGRCAAGAGKVRSDYRKRSIASLTGDTIGAIVRSVRAELWEEWAEMSMTHRDLRDPDVATVLRLVQHEAELDRLESNGSLPHVQPARRAVVRRGR
jgi:hypothetical protein